MYSGLETMFSKVATTILRMMHTLLGDMNGNCHNLMISSINVQECYDIN